MMNIYYENSKGVQLNLLKPPFMLQTGELFDYKWAYKNVSGSKVSGKLTGFYKEIEERTLLLSILNYGKKAYNDAIDSFYNVTEQDVLDFSPGKLHVGDMYLLCYVIASTKTEWEDDIELLDNEITLITDYPFWIRETTYHYLPEIKQSEPGISDPDITGGIYESKNLERGIVIPGFPFDMFRESDLQKRYPLFDLPFDFVGTYGKRILNNDAFSGCNFKMTIYGYAEAPQVLIGDHQYEVDAVIYEGERLEIDSRFNTIKKIGRLGEEENLYNARNKRYSVFQKIPPGTQTVSWPGTFGVDIILYEERSEPRWSF